MNISTKETLASGIVLAAIGLIAVAIAWTYNQVEDANRQRQQAGEIARRLSDLRLVTFEYRENRPERARVQWLAASGRLDRLIANNTFSGPAQNEIVSDLRERRTLARNIFAELSSSAAAKRADRPGDESRQPFERQLFNRLLIIQQENLSGAYRLTDLAAERIQVAQQRVLTVILAGLALIALIAAGASWLIRRDILRPIVKLQQATHEVARGNWNHKIGIARGDEIGALANNFNSMVRALRDAFAQIERTNRELEAFSYSVSHDLRAPLRGMDGVSLVLLEDYGDTLGAEGKDALARIRAASQRMGALIDDLLRLSQVTRAELRLTRIDLGAIARDTADTLAREQPGRSVQWKIEPGLSVRADPALMRIAMQNLLANAWKFTGRTEKAVIRVGALQRDGQTEYFVADNGAGFDMKYADRLFGAFQRLHHTGDFPGSGIGLAIVQRIIRRHGGEIRAEAKEGDGAAFFFTLKESDHGADEQDHPLG
mgnify:CR=1 FL=1